MNLSKFWQQWQWYHHEWSNIMTRTDPIRRCHQMYYKFQRHWWQLVLSSSGRHHRTWAFFIQMSPEESRWHQANPHRRHTESRNGKGTYGSSFSRNGECCSILAKPAWERWWKERTSRIAYELNRINKHWNLCFIFLLSLFHVIDT